MAFIPTIPKPRHPFVRMFKEWRDTVRLITIKINHQPLLAETHREEIEHVNVLLESLYANVLAFQPKVSDVFASETELQLGSLTSPRRRNQSRMKEKRNRTRTNTTDSAAAEGNKEDSAIVCDTPASYPETLPEYEDTLFLRENPQIQAKYSQTLIASNLNDQAPAVRTPTKYVLIIKHREDKTKYISAAGQPPCIKLPLKVAEAESAVLCQVLKDKAKRVLQDEEDKIVWNRDVSWRHKNYMDSRDQVVYMDGLLESEYVELKHDDDWDLVEVDKVSLDTIWTSTPLY
ncbi:hypothetical protein DL98DRAFT_596661 [Cadophora sp. DSE1049]|nr:hypothetical protein DL98DRAFT_596661 [Cadophora sp. DSE1049]